jgi:hypothetical protein
MSATARPCREELEAVVRHYHHVESEHERANPEGSVRHHLEQRLHEQRGRFEHLLAAYVPDEQGRRAWRAYLQHRGVEPPGPPAADPLLFRGRSEAGSVVEIRKDRSGELAVAVDGRLAERLPVLHVPIAEGPAVFRLDGTEFQESFAAPDRAVRALREFLSAEGSPPWDQASELLSDGLIDVNFGLTERGRRALHLRPGGLG